MKPTLHHDAVLHYAETLLQESFTTAQLATEGIDHVVLLVLTTSGKRLVVKTGPNADADIYVLRTLAGTGIKVPQLLETGMYTEGGTTYPLAVMTCFTGVLLQNVADETPYIPQILDELERTHAAVSSDEAGYVVTVCEGRGETWKNFLASNLTGNADFDWAANLEHPLVDKALLADRLSEARELVSHLPGDLPLGLLHTDLNGSNIFIKDDELEGMVDWSDAKFGDPLFDFARLRMHIQNYSTEEPLHAYFNELRKRGKDAQREQIYYLLNLLDYVNWYIKYNRTERLSRLLTLLGNFS